MNVGYKHTPYNYKFFNCSGTVLQYQKVHFFFKSTAQQNFLATYGPVNDTQIRVTACSSASSAYEFKIRCLTTTCKSLSSLAAPDPKKGSGESQYKKFDCCRNSCSTNQIAPRQISDVTHTVNDFFDLVSRYRISLKWKRSE